MVLDVAVALCRQDVARSAERSCAERALSAQLPRMALPDAEQLVLPMQQAELKQSSMVLPVQAVSRQPRVAEAAE